MLDPSRPPILTIVGPTATGKTEVGLLTAQRLNGEIISADSQAVYCEFDIGTAKPSVEERARAPIHLIDVADARQGYSVAEFQQDAAEVEAGIRSRGHLPLLVGGTGFYVRGYLENLSLSETRADPAVRSRLMGEANAVGSPALHSRLRMVDPVCALRLHQNDLVRIVRALEVFEVTGRRQSEWQAEDAANREARPSVRFGLTCEREQLWRRIEARCQAMWDGGLAGEVKDLLEAGYSPELNAMQSVGYREAVKFVLGDWDAETALQEMIRATKRYAKRQWTWFRADPSIRWVEIGGAEPAELAESISLTFVNETGWVGRT